MLIRNGLGAIAAAGLLAIGAAAEAAQVIYDFEGVFTDGRDVTGVFGAAGSDLAGVSLSGRFVRDDAAPGAVMLDDGVQTSISGNGAVYGSLLVNGRSWFFGNSLGSQSQAANVCGAGGCFDSFHFAAEDNREFFSNGGFFHTLSAFTFSGQGPGGGLFASRDYHTLSDLTAGSGVSLSGSVDISEYAVLAGNRYLYNFEVQDARFVATSLVRTIEDDAVIAVPEPSAWALAITGFGLAGASLRRSRRRVLQCA